MRWLFLPTTPRTSDWAKSREISGACGAFAKKGSEIKPACPHHNRIQGYAANGKLRGVEASSSDLQAGT